MNFEQEVPFARQIGVELTFVPKNPTSYHFNTFDFCDRLTHRPLSWGWYTAQLRKKAKKLKVPGRTKIYRDPGCVEFPSPILKSWKSAKSWYQQAVDAADRVGLTPYEESQEGGMGHIHMGGLSNHERSQVAVELYKHPYLSWLFASPNATGFCISIAGILYYRYKFTHQFVLLEHKNVSKLFNYLDTNRFGAVDTRLLESLTKSCIISNQTNTLEWRAFDSASDWDEQASMIAFYQRFVSYATQSNTGLMADLRGNARLGPTMMRQSYRTDITHCVSSFKALLKNMELEWADYKHLVKLNLEPAFQFGRRE